MNSSLQPTILLWNCRSLQSKVRDLQFVLCSPMSTSLFAPYTVPYLVALTECHTPVDAVLPTISSYSWSIFPGTSHGGGLALLTHNSVSCTELPNLPVLPSHADIHPNSAVMYRLIRFPRQVPFIVGVVYLSPSTGGVSAFCASSLMNSFRAAASLSFPLLILGDYFFITLFGCVQPPLMLPPTSSHNSC